MPYIPIPPPIPNRNMKTQFTPQLLRDMYAGWDSSAVSSTKPMKKLKIENVDKLAGYITTSHPNKQHMKFVCVGVNERYDSYDFIFQHSKWHTIEVSVLKDPHNHYDHNLSMRIIGYTALIRHVKDNHIVSEWWKERPFLTQTGVQSKDEFLKAMGELCNKYVEYVEETEFQNSPWYNKFWQKTKEFINNSI